MNNQIYLDNAATTRVADEVFEKIKEYSLEKYGNAGSIHSLGRASKNAIAEAEQEFLSILGGTDGSLIFTSCGTESNNLAIKGLLLSLPTSQKKHIIVSQIEHDCVINATKWLSSLNINVDVTFIPVDKYGLINPQDIKQEIRPETVLVSIMHANNEIGTIEPIREIGQICREHKIVFHTDACQSFTKVPIDVEKDYIDMLTISAQKIHGPKGVAALYVKNNIKLTPLLHGGGQQDNLRSGTENVAGIVGFAKATELHTTSNIDTMTKLRDQLTNSILSELPNTVLNGHPTLRLCNNVNISFQGIDTTQLVLMLDSYGISASTSSACNSTSLEPSHVSKAICGDLVKLDTVRFSLSRYTTESDIKFTFDKLKLIYPNLLKIR